MNSAPDTTLESKADYEVWANILLPERYLGIYRYPSQEAAKKVAEEAELERGEICVLTENGLIPFTDQVIAQVKL